MSLLDLRRKGMLEMNKEIQTKLANCDKIIVGISGGADSVALTHILLNEFSSDKLICAHINHGIREVGAINDENFVIDFCDKFGLECKVLKVDVPKIAKEKNISTEECGRNLRYEFFSSLCSENDLIATAHNLDDNAETVLFNLVRGTGIDGLCGIPSVRGNVVRPILDMSRDEIEKYCELHGLAFVTDESNFENDYSRNKLRNIVFPVLKELNPEIIKSFGRTSEILKGYSEFVDKSVHETLKIAKHKYGLRTQELLKLDDFLVGETIRMFLKENGVYSYESRHIKEIVKKLSLGGSVNLVNNIIVVIKQGILSLNFGFGVDETDKCLVFDCDNIYKNKNIKISSKIHLKEGKINNLFFYTSIDCDKISKELTVGKRREGEKFQKANTSFHKSVKKLLNEAKIPSHLRDDVIIIRDGDEVVYIENIGVSDKYKVDKHTNLHISIDIMEIKGDNDG